jgi:DNA-binding transcriptional MerR regulator
MMTDDQEFSIQELTERTGISRRTIHFYVQQGLLPPPSGAGLGSTYHEIHLLRLQLIPVLRQRGMRLDEIREEFQSLKRADLSQIYDQAIKSSPPSPSPLPSGQSHTHYSLPAGMTLITPSTLSLIDRKKLNQLLNEVQRIWGGDSTQKPK